LIDLVTGVIVDAFYSHKQKAAGMIYLSKIQKDWVYLQYFIMEHKPLDLVGHGKGKLRRLLIKMDESKIKTWLISLLYVFLFVSWSFRTFPGDPGTIRFIVITYYVLLGFWTLELLIKIGAYYDKFFTNLTNIGVFSHYIGTVVSLVLWHIDDVLYPYFPVIISFRLLWSFQIFLSFESFRKIFRIFMMALPTFSALILIIYIIAYIYALIGMELFGFLMQEGIGINRHANFKNFGVAVMTLFRVSVGENWTDILVDLQREVQPNYICREFKNTYENYSKYGFTKCGESNSGYAFLTSFYMLVSFIFFNLLIAILLEAFEVTHNQEETLIKQHHIVKFRKHWSKFDPNGKGMIKSTDMPALLKVLGPPHGPPFHAVTNRALGYVIGGLLLPLYRKRKVEIDLDNRGKSIRVDMFYNYFDILLALSRASLVQYGGRKYKE
jgi:hypothetical protein